jgi:hypothetical protein
VLGGVFEFVVVRAVHVEAVSGHVQILAGWRW